MPAPPPSPSVLRHLTTMAQTLAKSEMLEEHRAKATHERFNVFTTLLSATDEVRLHTRLLHCLLDPEGIHDCGTLFLDLFLETLLELPGKDHEGEPLELLLPKQVAGWSVSKEAPRPPYGSIDLLLEGAGYGIAIENKIYAAEQQEQLARYGRFLSAQYGDASQVIYLTLDGKTSCTHGNGASYLRVSYTEHILAWLEKCLRATYQIIPVNQILMQYRQVVLQITGNTPTSSTMNAIKNLVLSNPDILRYQNEINHGIEAAKAAFLDQLADDIIGSLGGGFRVQRRHDMVKGGFGMDLYGDLIITPPDKSPLRAAPFEIWLEHIAKWEALVIGVVVRDGKRGLSDDLAILFTKLDANLDREFQTQGLSRSTNKDTWGSAHWPTGWHDIIRAPGMGNEGMANLMTKPDEAVADICQRARRYLDILERAYIEVTATPAHSIPALM